MTDVRSTDRWRRFVGDFTLEFCITCWEHTKLKRRTVSCETSHTKVYSWVTKMYCVDHVNIPGSSHAYHECHSSRCHMSHVTLSTRCTEQMHTKIVDIKNSHPECYYVGVVHSLHNATSWHHVFCTLCVQCACVRSQSEKILRWWHQSSLVDAQGTLQLQMFVPWNDPL